MLQTMLRRAALIVVSCRKLIAITKRSHGKARGLLGWELR
jgi:hypothetical protein